MSFLGWHKYGTHLWLHNRFLVYFITHIFRICLLLFLDESSVQPALSFGCPLRWTVMISSIGCWENVSWLITELSRFFQTIEALDTESSVNRLPIFLYHLLPPSRWIEYGIITRLRRSTPPIFWLQSAIASSFTCVSWRTELYFMDRTLFVFCLQASFHRKATNASSQKLIIGGIPMPF